MTTEESPEKTIVMVTGGSGLVGSAINDFVTTHPKENEEWVFLSSKDGDIRDRKATEAIFDKFKPTHVIHLAAKVGGLFANLAQKVSNLHLRNNNNLHILALFNVQRKSFPSHLNKCMTLDTVLQYVTLSIDY